VGLLCLIEDYSNSVCKSTAWVRRSAMRESVSCIEKFCGSAP
jgi:hypothetical protein